MEIENTKTKLTIHKSLEFSKVFIDLNNYETKVFLFGIAKVRSSKKEQNKNCVEFSSSEFCDFYNIENKKRNCFNFQKFKNEMKNKKIKIPGDTLMKEPELIFEKIKYGNGILELTFNKKLMKHLFFFEGMSYIYYKLSEISKLKGKYSIVFYEYFHSLKHLKEEKYVKIESLKELINFENIETGVFNRSVFLKTVEEINQQTNLSIEMKSVKNYKNIVGYKFNIKTKDKNEESKEFFFRGLKKEKKEKYANSFSKIKDVMDFYFLDNVEELKQKILENFESGENFEFLLKIKKDYFDF